MAADGDIKWEPRAPLVVGDEECQNPEHFEVPERYRGAIKEILLTRGMILDRVQKTAAEIAECYSGKVPHMLCVLKGAFPFCSDVCAALQNLSQPYTLDFIRCKSYEGTASTGTVTIDGVKEESIKGRHVVLVEDIVDTGLTLRAVIPELKKLGAKSVRVCALLEKRNDCDTSDIGDFVSFSIPDKFVIGYGLDFNEAFRDLAHIAVISEDGIKDYAEWFKSLQE